MGAFFIGVSKWGLGVESNFKAILALLAFKCQLRFICSNPQIVKEHVSKGWCDLGRKVKELLIHVQCFSGYLHPSHHWSITRKQCVKGPVIRNTEQIFQVGERNVMPKISEIDPSYWDSFQAAGGKTSCLKHWCSNLWLLWYISSGVESQELRFGIKWENGERY